MEFLDKYIAEMAAEHQQLIDKAIIDMLRMEGFTIDDNPDGRSISAIAESLKKSGKHVRCEVFYKPALEEYKCTMKVLPFIEPTNEMLTRMEIYRILGLQEQGYIL